MVELDYARLTRYDREKAVFQFKVRLCSDIQVGREPRYWRLGVSSDTVIMVDFDIRDIIIVLEFSRALARILRKWVLIVRTEHGYHVIVLENYYNYISVLHIFNGILGKEWLKIEYRYKPYERDIDDLVRSIEAIVKRPVTMPRHYYEWNSILETIMRWYKEEMYNAQFMDKLHVELSLKRHYTTLRISGKYCKQYDIRPYLLVAPDGAYYGFHPDLLDRVREDIEDYMRKMIRIIVRRVRELIRSYSNRIVANFMDSLWDKVIDVLYDRYM